MWLHYVIFIVFIVLTICGGGGKIGDLVDFAKRAGIIENIAPVEVFRNATDDHKLLQTEPFDNSSSSPSSPPSDDLPCLDKLLSLEERIDEADYIFTGRVQWIGGTITHRASSQRVNETTGPGGRIGGVSVQRFLKGGETSSEKEFLVEGFESPLLCHAKSKVREDWIFLVSRISGKHVGLVSSLLPLHKRNLRRIKIALTPLKDERFLQQKGK